MIKYKLFRAFLLMSLSFVLLLPQTSSAECCSGRKSTSHCSDFDGHKDSCKEHYVDKSAGSIANMRKCSWNENNNQCEQGKHCEDSCVATAP